MSVEYFLRIRRTNHAGVIEVRNFLDYIIYNLLYNVVARVLLISMFLLGGYFTLAGMAGADFEEDENLVTVIASIFFSSTERETRDATTNISYSHFINSNQATRFAQWYGTSKDAQPFHETAKGTCVEVIEEYHTGRVKVAYHFDWDRNTVLAPEYLSKIKSDQSCDFSTGRLVSIP
ncbi:hypothetical protein PH5382_03066 [Phaeobacter sp. CECT 5382]|uniref:hypothetical protein n=1 Tax=Phaeobacter sp. CECT 5382 TaxID=1712645 RepID=UPI0006DAC560|nr:hypothetical protein [Phaeobacter sp. CECT 5382]CUH89120.1 hypothetical protein PH5382_03066 [Phaeobacter sp. CECT 5382]